MTIHCFVGPSQPGRDKPYPEARQHGPVRHGQLLNLDIAAGDVVAIIDGVFYTEPAVRHKEILEVMAQGVAVVGGGSMGALRAAELHPLGMTGVGRVFGWYATGEIDGDDEVALLHGEEDGVYRTLSVALVSVRAACEDLVTEGLLDTKLAAILLKQIKQEFFAQRTVPAIRSCATGLGIPQEIVLDLIRRVDGSEPDVKTADAELVLAEAIRLHEDLRRRPTTMTEVQRPTVAGTTDSVVSWRRATAWQGFDSEAAVDQMAVQAAALCVAEFPEFYARVTIPRVADAWGCAPTYEAVADEFMRRTAFDATDETLFSEWLEYMPASGERPDRTTLLVRIAVVTYRESPGRRTRVGTLRGPVWQPSHIAALRQLCLSARRLNMALATTMSAEQSPGSASLATLLEWVADLWRTSPTVEAVVRAGYARGFDDLDAILVVARQIVSMRDDPRLEAVREIRLNLPGEDFLMTAPVEDAAGVGTKGE